ncbi:hypothetical protein NLU13_6974 [Sarocladium strictum]|uniref:Membrane protein PTM1 n=1 Tax=Sarocladium strictum TaxID=5046 RepID=A0AA39GGR1_SARSR|nr:hypothetical protein NLU13_6974 [Sarocladium strictum]
MKLLTGLLGLGLFAWTAQALEMELDQTEENGYYCTGMYGRKTWGGPVDPFIEVKFLTDNSKTDKPMASMIIFEWRDQDYVGVPSPNGYTKLMALCDEARIEKNECNKTEIGEYIVAANATEKAKSQILTTAVDLSNPKPVKYQIKKTGYYCLFTSSFNVDEYKAVAEWRNAYGELSATQIPKLPFYGGITVVYALLACYWSFLYYQHRHDILAVQNYITAILVFLVVEMFVTWGYYEQENRHGTNAGTRVLLIIVGILNAARNSFSFFLLLIVCMGYGVVKPTLGRTMILVRWLAAAHFVFGLAYSITNLLVSPENVGLFVFLVMLPLAGTMTAFYVWTLNSLNLTLKDLRERRQHAKELMYKKLWWAILATIFAIFGFIVFNSFTFVGYDDPNFVPFHWKTRWFVLDGWPLIVYFLDVAWIAYIWRPTSNNRRFAMSDEIAQDDDGNFEIGDIGMPDDSDDEEAGVTGRKDGAAAAGTTNGGATVGASVQPGGSSSSQLSGATSAAARDTQPRHVPRDSMDGETIFAVGEDGDRMSDVDSDEENAKLVKAK